jgi:hypothetical protein
MSITESGFHRAAREIYAEPEAGKREGMVKMLWSIMGGNRTQPSETARFDRRATDHIHATSYVKKKRTADELESLLTHAGHPLDYDHAISGLLAGGCKICENEKDYYRILMIVIAQNQARFVTADGKVGLAAW